MSNSVRPHGLQPTRLLHYFHLGPTYRAGTSPWMQSHRGYWGVDCHFPSLQDSNYTLGEVSQEGYCHPSIKCSATKVGVSKRSHYQLTFNSRTRAQRFSWWEKQGLNREFLTSPQRKLFYLQQNVKKFNTKGSLKNSENCGERQLRGDGWIH